MLHTAVAADQAVIAVVAAIGHVRWTRSGHIVVKASVRAVVAVGVISAIRPIVGIITRTIAVRVGRRVIRTAVRARTPGVIAVVVCGVPGIVGDVRVVVEDDRVAATPSAPPSPVASPGMKAPTEAAAHCPPSAAEGYADAEA